MKYLSLLLAALPFLGATNAGAFDIQKGQWIGYIKREGVMTEAITFYANDQKDFKGYSFSDSGVLLRFTGSVTDGNRILLLRRGSGFFDEAEGRISGRRVRFQARFPNAQIEAFRVGTSLKVAGAYEGFNSFGDTTLMLVLPNNDVLMTFTGDGETLTLKGRTDGRFFTVFNKERTVRVRVTITGDGARFRGEGRVGNRAFRVFGKTLPQVPEEVSKQ